MAEKPNARRAGLLADDAHPGVNVGRVIVDGDRICVGDRACAAKHAALVDPYAGDPLCSEPLGQKLIRGSPDAERIIAVAAGGA